MTNQMITNQKKESYDQPDVNQSEGGKNDD